MRRPQGPSRDGARRVLSVALTVLAVVAVWAVLVLPQTPDALSPSGFLRVPVEALVLVVLVVLLPPRWRGPTAVGFGVVLGLLLIVKVLNIGFRVVFGRDFDPVIDWAYLGPGVGVLRDTDGTRVAVLAVVGAVVFALAALTLLPLATLRLSRATRRHRRGSLVGATALGLVWVLAATTGFRAVPGRELASAEAVERVYADVGHLRADLADRSTFETLARTDPLADTPDRELLTALEGKDVLLVFVESYGRVAVQDSTFASVVVDALDEGTSTLGAAGWSSASGFLTSPTFGAGSWLAHLTLQSGLWVDTQQRYDQLMLQRQRRTLTSTFRGAGWHTVFTLPNVKEEWPEGEAFYGYDELLDDTNTGYTGPGFGWAKAPDQFTLDAFERLVLDPEPRAPVMAEIDLASSHHPWTPIPPFVPWEELGDGSVYKGTRRMSPTYDELFNDPAAVRAAYGESLVYTWRTLVSWLERQSDRDLVVVALGDHQPHSYVSGNDADHDVPISVLSRDPEVMSRISTWGWHDGLHPGRDAPVWRMDEFRDRFLTAFSE